MKSALQPVSPSTSGPAPEAVAHASVATLSAAEPRAKDPMVNLFRYHLEAQRGELERQAQRLRASCDMESVHRMRIATRKLRAALRAFKDFAPDADRKSLNCELQWLAAELGEVRDLDVYDADLAEHLRALPPDDQSALTEHRRLLSVARQRQAEALHRTLASDRYRALRATLERFAADLASPAALRRWGKFAIRDGVDAYLDTALAKVARHARRYRAHPQPERLHAVRIESKKYRYLLEFFQPIYPEPLDEALRAARKLQKRLGDYQDARLAQQSIRAFSSDPNLSSQRPEELLALGRILEAHEQKARRASHRFAKFWSSFKDRQPSFPVAD
jgi:CHAD domain-containing protein